MSEELVANRYFCLEVSVHHLASCWRVLWPCYKNMGVNSRVVVRSALWFPVAGVCSAPPVGGSPFRSSVSVGECPSFFVSCWHVYLYSLVLACGSTAAFLFPLVGIPVFLVPAGEGVLSSVLPAGGCLLSSVVPAGGCLLSS